MNPAILLAVLLIYFLPLVLGGLSSSAITRGDFPEDFVFGSGTSAYQYEGAALEDGRALTLWDIFTHDGKPGGGTGDVASDGYHKYKEDIKLLYNTGIEAYRLSLSWSRLLPGGRGTVNPKAVEYYNNVINELLKYGIPPHVTLHHMDLPLVFEQEYGGWLSPKIIDDFKEYADVCFREFGDRVTHWTTITEPNIYAMDSYDNGRFPPNRCSYPFGKTCKEGNSTTEPYIGAHNMILSHAAAVKLYRTKYQAIQKGKIGFNVYTIWSYPLTNSTEDKVATKRVLDFMPGWIISPMVFGDYPEIMRKNAGSRLPSFTESESKEVKGSFDFLAINYYFSIFVADNPNASKMAVRDINADMFAKFTVFEDDKPIPQLLPPGRIPNKPLGLLKMLKHIKTTYGNPPIYIHENGCGLGESDTLNDTWRITYIGDHIGSIHKALRDGSDVRGYFTWSFLDVFELLAGYKSRFGLYHVDFASKELTRVPKLSAQWYSDFLKNARSIKIRKVGRKAAAHQI
ncbi:Beta-glucosidase 22 [Platanthera guangdongensis]|uniref:Beta-glucosidase 22 n=1 Tax=Platanthera guangdongensis TaxID=2320717 RepID=A0ABR2M821_9ASPA